MLCMQNRQYQQINNSETILKQNNNKNKISCILEGDDRMLCGNGQKKRKKRFVKYSESPAALKIKENPYVNTLMEDSRLRTVMFTLPGMGLNLIYAGFNGVIGISRHSAWYGSLAAYYIFLSLMRFLAVSYAKDVYVTKKPKGSLKEREWKVYRSCGAMLSMVSIALGGAVIVLVGGNGGKSYPGLMIYAAATYTFVKMGLAIKNMIQARKKKSCFMMTLRNISCADALVSMLSLQTALLAAFGEEKEMNIPLMNALTGAAVCLMILALGIYMLYDAKKRADYQL